MQVPLRHRTSRAFLEGVLCIFYLLFQFVSGDIEAAEKRGAILHSFGLVKIRDGPSWMTKYKSLAGVLLPGQF